jgi:prevent-host-death family protein
VTTVGAYEAKTRLAELLDMVARGERIVITRHGVPVATLQPPDSDSGADVRAVVAKMRRFRKGRRIPLAELKSMIDEGRD